MLEKLKFFEGRGFPLKNGGYYHMSPSIVEVREEDFSGKSEFLRELALAPNDRWLLDAVRRVSSQANGGRIYLSSQDMKWRETLSPYAIAMIQRGDTTSLVVEGKWEDNFYNCPLMMGRIGKKGEIFITPDRKRFRIMGIIGDPWSGSTEYYNELLS